MWRAVGAYLRWAAKHTAPAGKYRMLESFCDYGAHYRVGWIASVNGEDWGQSCFRHAGALAIDAMREGDCTIRPARSRDRDRDRVIRLD